CWRDEASRGVRGTTPTALRRKRFSAANRARDRRPHLTTCRTSMRRPKAVLAIADAHDTSVPRIKRTRYNGGRRRIAVSFLRRTEYLRRTAADFGVATRAFKPSARKLRLHGLGRDFIDRLPRLLGSGGNDPPAARSDRVVHRVGSQVCAIGPRDRAEFDAHLSEVAWI